MSSGGQTLSSELIADVATDDKPVTLVGSLEILQVLRFLFLRPLPILHLHLSHLNTSTGES